MTDDRLRGWKEIGAFLGTSPRTAQRWEQTLGLPVSRMELGQGVAVYAERAELSKWMQAIEAGPRAAASDAGPATTDQTSFRPGANGESAGEPIASQPVPRRRWTARWPVVVPFASLALVVVLLLASAMLSLRSPSASANLRDGTVTMGTAHGDTPPPRDLYMFTLRKADGVPSSIGIVPGSPGTISRPGGPVVVLLVAPAGDKAVLSVYEVKQRSPAASPISNLVTLTLALGESRNVSLPMGYQTVQWTELIPAKRPATPPSTVRR